MNDINSNTGKENEYRFLYFLIPILSGIYIASIAYGDKLNILNVFGFPFRVSYFFILSIIFSGIYNSLRIKYTDFLFILISIFVIYISFSSSIYVINEDLGLTSYPISRSIFLLLYFFLFFSILSYDWRTIHIITVAKTISIIIAPLCILSVIDSSGLLDVPEINDVGHRGLTFFSQRQFLVQDLVLFGERTSLSIYFSVVSCLLFCASTRTINSRLWSFFLLATSILMCVLIAFSHNRAGLLACMIGIVIFAATAPHRSHSFLYVGIFIVSTGFVTALVSPSSSTVYEYYLTGEVSAVEKHLQGGPSYNSAEQLEALKAYKDNDLQSSDSLRFSNLMAAWEKLKTNPWGTGASKLNVSGEATEPHSIVTYVLNSMGYPGIIWALAVVVAVTYRLIESFRRKGSRDLIAVIIPMSCLACWLSFSVMHDVIYFGVFWLMLGIFVSTSARNSGPKCAAS